MVLSATFMVLSSTHSVSAVYSGPGGGGGSCTSNCGGGGGPSDVYGYGWYIFPSNGSSRPARMRDASLSWNTAMSTCSSHGISQIAAFIIETPNHSPTSAWVYNYSSRPAGEKNHTWPTYLGASGGSWITNESAASQYQAFGGNNLATDNVGWFCYGSEHVPKPNLAYWKSVRDVTTGAVGSGITVNPGDTVSYSVSISNSGDAAGSANAADILNRSTSDGTYGPGILNYATLTNSGGASGSGTLNWGTVTVGPGGSWSKTFTVKIKDADDLPTSDSGNPCYANNSFETTANTVRVNINCPKPYDLTPTLASTLPAATASDIVPTDPNMTGIITNVGRKASPSNDSTFPGNKVAVWEYSGFTLLPGATVPPASSDTPQDPQAYYRVASGSRVQGNITIIDSGSGSYAAKSTNTVGQWIAQVLTSGLPLGTRICWGLSIQHYAYGSGNDWRHSAPKCVMVAGEPTVQVQGGDLLSETGLANLALPGVATSVTTHLVGGGLQYEASLVQYAIASSGSITGTASGAATIASHNMANDAARSPMSFSNASQPGGSTKRGGYPFNEKANLVGDFPSADADATNTATSVTINSWGASGQVYYKNATSITLKTPTIPAGAYHIINAPNATVHITGDLLYAAQATDPTHIPQLVIIAKNIAIDNAVKSVHAWLIASNSINTCADVGTVTSSAEFNRVALSSSTCDNQLTVYGPVETNHLYLLRTYGASLPGENQSEVFDTTPDAYIWAYNYHLQHSDDQVVETYSQTVAPRF